MLGITVNDAILIGALVASCLAGWLGKKSGEALSKTKPLEPATAGIAAGFVDRDLMQRLTTATETIAATLKQIVGIQTDEHERAVEDRLERIEAALMKKHDDDDRANRSVQRTGDRVERSLDRTADKITGRKPRD
jgi:hypothetical protein